MKYLKKSLTILLGLVMMIQTVQIPKAAENREYLDISMADIIVAWYNASGVAIGYTSILNDIYTSFGNATLEDLVNNGVLKSNATNDPEEIKQLIGYGNLTAPTVYVDMERFRYWFTRHPSTGDTKESLEAMFSSLGGDSGGIQGLACVLGMVANLGKIPYSFEPNTASNVTNENVTNVTSLKNVYNNFVQTNYFVTLIQNTESGEDDYLKPYSFRNSMPSYIPEDYRYGTVSHKEDGSGYCEYGYMVPKDVVVCKYGNTLIVVNTTDEIKLVRDYPRTGGYQIINYVIQNTAELNRSDNVPSKDYLQLYSGVSYTYEIGMCITIPTNITGKENIVQYATENNPWSEGATGSNGTTNYINSTVGNLDSENYQNANPNITPNEYMYIFNRNTYETIIDTINQNTNNGQYTENGDIINNYNNTYIQDTSTPNVRPSLPPTSGELPAQPFITPRPDLPIEEVEDIIYGGNVPGEIEKKFPFCIPWDIKACVDYFWSPTRKAPHIHWNASFGEWGNLGEIDVDLSPYNTVATIHRALMLIAWIVGLAIITPKILP